MNIQKIIEDIEMAKVENNYPMAKEIALTWLKNHTDDYRLYEELADIYLFEGNIEKASEVHVMKWDLMKGLSLLRRAYILAPDEPMVINDLSVALIAAWQENEARTVLARLGQGDLVDTVKNSEI